MPKSQKAFCNATLIGCGKMGSAMIRSWLKDDLIRHIDVISPSPIPNEIQNDSRVHCLSEFENTKITSDILILAVKPQVLKEVSKNIAINLTDKTVLLSIVAGQSLSTLGNIFGLGLPIIRAMPNTPAAIGQGITVAVMNEIVSKNQKSIAECLLNSSGQSRWLKDEKLMDAVTALSGSGPAYVFYLIEVLSQAGENLGLDRKLSKDLARQTVIGSAALAAHEHAKSAHKLREDVTSPGGTTKAALDVLMDGRFQDLFNEALSAAKNRAKELNQ